ncbi:MAG: hypothetical protein US89_C0009G0034 [Candidatus Peregrinibacteria bacterium GW2011_GWF2_38_29]|nr:MAG: hypothetical protein US89_C0009G0034 [Candidatus Peregrinibacteria bacterium GW2011_GWF2_38_29]
MKKLDRNYHMICGNMNSGGRTSFDLLFNGDFSKDEKEKVIADHLAAITGLMLDQGYIGFLSASDIAEKYGRSRQFWEKLLREGKILYQQTKSGKITTNLWVEAYLRKDEEIEKYVKAMKEMRKVIIKREDRQGVKYGPITCTWCGKETFEYSYNQGRNINGVCRAPGCNFQIVTQK